MEEMKYSDMYLQPGYLFRRAHQLATSAFNEVARGFGITAVQMASLVCIRDFPGVDATRLSELIRFDRTTIGHVLGRLEQKGLIKRREGNKDKRTKTLHITKKGEKLLSDLIDLTPSIAVSILEPLSPDEGEELLRLLIKLDRHASSVGGSAGVPPSSDVP